MISALNKELIIRNRAQSGFALTLDMRWLLSHPEGFGTSDEEAESRMLVRLRDYLANQGMTLHHWQNQQDGTLWLYGIVPNTNTQVMVWCDGYLSALGFDTAYRTRNGIKAPWTK